MNISKTIQKTFHQFLILFLAFASALVLAGVVSAWTGPTGAAPSNNVSAPINVGPNWQLKSGTLELNGSPALQIDSGSHILLRDITSCTSLSTDGSGNVICGGGGANPPIKAVPNCPVLATDGSGNVICGSDNDTVVYQ